MKQLLLAVLLPLGAFPQETRDSETVRYKSFAEILQEIAKTADGAASKQGEKVLVVWLVDNASMLKNSKHGALLAEYIPRFFAGGKARFYHSLFAMGEDARLALKATDDARDISRAVEALADDKPDDRIKNCLANVRTAARYAAGFSGKKFLVLFTQENGDNEDNLEPTLKMLKDAGIVFFPICGEAVYSDPYWESTLDNTGSFAADSEAYRRLKFQLKGPESAYIEFPYSWPYAWPDPSYSVPSGFGTYGLNRLATHSGGRYFLYLVDRSVFSFCRQYGCSVCAGNHKDCGGNFDVTKLKMTAPDIGSRDQIRERLGREKLFLAVLNAWEKLHREGLLRSSPRLRFTGGRLQEVKPSSSGAGTIALGSDWKSNKLEALRAAADLGKIAAEFAAFVEQEGAKADKRIAATADALLVHLRALHLNLGQLASFCDEMDRIVRLKKPSGPDPGPASSLMDDYIGAKIIGTSYRNVVFCHGGAALRDVRLLGGEAGEKEKREVLDLADKMIDRHRGTPWEILIRRAALVVFLPAVEVKEGRDRRDRPRSGSNDTETGSPTRPNRPTTGGGSGGTATGP